MKPSRELVLWLSLGFLASTVTIWQPSLFPVFFVAYFLLTLKRHFLVALSLLCSLLIALAVVPMYAMFQTETQASLIEGIIPIYSQMDLFGLLLIGLLGTYIGTLLDAINARPIETEPTQTISLPQQGPQIAPLEMSDIAA